MLELVIFLDGRLHGKKAFLALRVLLAQLDQAARCKVASLGSHGHSLHNDPAGLVHVGESGDFLDKLVHHSWAIVLCIDDIVLLQNVIRLR